MALLVIGASLSNRFQLRWWAGESCLDQEDYIEWTFSCEWLPVCANVCACFNVLILS